jgi:hypothetical protein
MKLLSAVFFLLATLTAMADAPREMYALRTKEPIKIDGILDEQSWKLIEPANNFIQNFVMPGMPCSQPTEVRLLYDDEALYVGAILFDVSKDSILRELGRRDTEGNTDAFGIAIDTYGDGINAFGFYVTAAGVQIDARYSANGRDVGWNAVWESRVRLYDDKWVVEFKIPFSALRFTNKDIQQWKINFQRKIRRHREISYWNNVDPAVDGFVNQFGVVYGIRDIKSPVRLSMTPYISTYADHFKNADGKNFTTTTFNAGADVKYGINESFTLDMTLIPDFGQVQSDNLVLNLSPFEVQFNDFRAFFTEGTELFNRGGLFYSRRVGGTPINYYKVSRELQAGERLIKNPSATQLYNATKISGRSNSGLGIGVFNAVTAPTFAIIENERGEQRSELTDPLSNYNVVVFDQSLKNNSYISFVNTNVMREGSFYDANVSGMQYRIMDKKIRHAFSGSGTVTQKLFPGIGNNSTGHAYNLDFGKISGNFQYNLAHTVRSDKYDIRDLGFMWANNESFYRAGVKYIIFKPFWKVNRLNTSLNFDYSQRYEPNLFQYVSIHGNANTTFSKQFFSVGGGFNVSPILGFDFFEPRSPGRFYRFPTNRGGHYWFSSDYRRKFALDGNISYQTFDENQRKTISYGLSPRYRATDRLFFVFQYQNEDKKDDIGFVSNVEDQIFFGKRDVKTLTNTLTTSYTFTHLMSVSLRIRHYWSKAVYSGYGILDDGGMVRERPYSRSHDVNFNAFNIDLVYVWNFTPGSEMSIVWKNSILLSDRNTDYTYLTNFRNTLDSPQVNSLSIKILYFLDYLDVKKRFKK